MEDYKKDTKVFEVEVAITNKVIFQVKSNSELFLWQWLMKQLKPIAMTQPNGVSIETKIIGTVESDECDAEVYGQAQSVVGRWSDTPTQEYKVFEQVKDIFGEEPRC